MHRVISGLILLLACCSASPPLRIGTNLWPGYEPLYLARDDRGWKPENIRLIEYPSATEVIRAFRTGNLEAACLTLDEALILRSGGLPVTIVLIQDFSSGADVIIARQGIARVEDLRGRLIGVESTALGAFLLTRALELHGMTTDDVRIQTIPVDEHEAAFASLDAVVTFEPVRAKLLAAGGKEIFSSKSIPGEIVDVLMVHDRARTEQRLQIQETVNGWFAAADALRDRPAPAMPRIAAHLQISEAEAMRAVEGLVIPSRAENLKYLSGPDMGRTAERLARILEKKNLLPGVPDLQGFFDPSFVRGGM